MDDPLKPSAGAPARTSLDDSIDELIRHLAECARVQEEEALRAIANGEVIIPPTALAHAPVALTQRRGRRDDRRILILLGITAIVAMLAAVLA